MIADSNQFAARPLEHLLFGLVYQDIVQLCRVFDEDHDRDVVDNGIEEFLGGGLGDGTGQFPLQLGHLVP